MCGEIVGICTCVEVGGAEVQLYYNILGGGGEEEEAAWRDGHFLVPVSGIPCWV